MRILQFLQNTIPALPDSVPTPKEELGMLKNLPVDELINRMISGMVTLAINLTIAVLVFYIGKFIINKLYNMVQRIMLKRRVDSSLTTFVLSFVRIVLYFILIVIAIGILGIETSSFLALFASAGVAIGMALSGTLQNFAGGVLILLLKPYKVGDYIEAQGYAGTVKEIQIFHTVIVTPDNKAIIIPNGGLSTGSVNNWSREDYRRVDWTIGISYGEDIKTARDTILDIINADPRTVRRYIEDDRAGRLAAAPASDDAEDTEESSEPEEEPRRTLFNFFSNKRRRIHRRNIERKRKADITLPKVDRSPAVVLGNLGDSAVELKARAWTRTSDYWGVYHDVLEAVYDRFNAPGSGLSFPFPQLDVHLANPDNKTTTIQ